VSKHTVFDVIDLLKHTIRQKQEALAAIPTFCTLEGKITKAMLELSIDELTRIVKDLEEVCTRA
jgi:hypothetical protein